MPYEKCSDINIYYEIHGNGDPVLFLNGLSSSVEHRRRLIKPASERFKIITPDIRGAGLTDKPHEPYSIDRFADDIYELLKKLAFKKTNIMGFSMGGFIAIDLAIKHPELIDRLILVSTKPAWSRPFGLSDEANRIFRSTEVSEKLLIDLFELVYGRDYKKRVSAESYVKWRFSEPDPQPLYAYLNQLDACEKFDMMGKIKDIRLPTLIITGNDDRLIDPKNSRWLHENIHGSKMLEYDGIGHMLVDEVPERLAEDAAAFISA